MNFCGYIFHFFLAKCALVFCTFLNEQVFLDSNSDLEDSFLTKRLPVPVSSTISKTQTGFPFHSRQQSTLYNLERGTDLKNNGSLSVISETKNYSENPFYQHPVGEELIRDLNFSKIFQQHEPSKSLFPRKTSFLRQIHRKSATFSSLKSDFQRRKYRNSAKRNFLSETKLFKRVKKSADFLRNGTQASTLHLLNSVSPKRNVNLLSRKNQLRIPFEDGKNGDSSKSVDLGNNAGNDFAPVTPPNGNTLNDSNYLQDSRIGQGTSISPRAWLFPRKNRPKNNIVLKQSQKVQSVDAQTSKSLSVSVSEISCFKSSTQSRFAAQFSTSGPLKSEPILEGSRKSCFIQALSKTEFFIDLRDSDFLDCGIHTCLNENADQCLCLTLRFQSITKLLLADDTMITIQCRPHQLTADTIQQFSVPIIDTNSNKQRSSHQIIAGGSQLKMQNKISLLRKQGNSFNMPVTPGATLQLGEEMMIKSVIQPSNGWQFSRMRDVRAFRIGKEKEQVDDDTVVVVDADGCRNTALKAVCPLNPQQETNDPLSSFLILRVFMIDGMIYGDELGITVRTTACLESQDCYSYCSDNEERHSQFRTKRSNHNHTSDWNSQIYFKIGQPQSFKNEGALVKSMSEWKVSAAVICLFLIVFVVVTFLLEK